MWPGEIGSILRQSYTRLRLGELTVFWIGYGTFANDVEQKSSGLRLDCALRCFEINTVVIVPSP